MKAKQYTMQRKLVDGHVAAETLGMTDEEFNTAVDEGYFPRALMLKFGSIVKYDLDGLIEYGRTGCIPFNKNSFTGRAMLHRLLTLEANLIGLWSVFGSSPFNKSVIFTDGNPFGAVVSETERLCRSHTSIINDIEALDLYKEFNFYEKDQFDLEERIDELTAVLLTLSSPISKQYERLFRSARELHDFSDDIMCIEKIREIVSLTIFDDLEHDWENDKIFDEQVDIDEVIDLWDEKFIIRYLEVIESLVPRNAN